MKPFMLMAVLLAATGAFGQCPFPASLTSTGICPGGALTVAAAKNISKIDWVRDGAVVSTVTATAAYNPIGITVAGGHGPGMGANQLNHPQGIYVDDAGNVIVADQNNDRIQAWTVGATSGNTIASSYGTGTDPLVSPVAVFPDAYNNLYITDYTKHRIEKWTFPASTGVIVAGGNGFGSAANQFDFPVGIFLDHNGNLYVADLNNHRVQRFASGSTAGVTVAGGNGPGSAANQLQFPTAVFVDEAGNVYVADDFNHRVQKWAPGAASGVTVAGGNGPGSGANQLQNPYGVYVDGFGNVFVADAGNNRVQQWLPGATSGVTIAGGNGIGPGSNQFNDPRSVWLDANGNLYVSDNLNYRVQKFTLQTTINNTYTAPSPGVYTAVVTFTTGCKESSNSITIEGSGTPSINIAASANPVNICTNVTFTATSTHAGSNPSFQWKVNGANAGTNQPTFQTGALHNGDVVTCVLTPNDACISNSPLSSNPITIGVNGLPQATMISKNVFCPGDTLAITSADSLSKIVWSESSSPVKTVTANPVGTAITVAGGNGQGAGANQLYLPSGAIVDARGNLYIADKSNNRIMKWAPGAAGGISVTNMQISAPNSMAVDAAGNVYIVINAGYVGKFPPGGGNSTIVAGANGIGSNADQLNNPVFLFLDGAGNLYIADANNYRVQKWAPGATSGVTVAGGNGAGPANNQIVPTSLFVDKAGNIFIADSYNNRVTEWAPGATSGIEILGPADINFGPRGIWVDKDGNLYLTSNVDNSVKKFAPGSKTGVTIAGGNGAGSGANQFNGPGSICMDAQGNLYVPDFFNNRVQEILQHPTIDTVYKATAPGTYTAAVTTSGGCVLTTNTIIVKPNVNPAVSVASSAAQACAGTQVTFTATPSNGGAAPVYSWQVNGTDAGVSGPSFTTIPGNGVSNIVCKMVSNADCALQPSASSSPVAISVSSAVTPSVSINASSTEICSGVTAAFVATPVNGGLNPVFQWTVNGNPAGTNSPNFNSSVLNDGDVVACQLSSNATCATPATAQSNSIHMRVKPVVPPVVNIKADPDPVCSGLPVTFSAAVTNGGASSRYQWQINGIDAGGAGDTGPTYTTTHLANGDAVSCLVSTDNVCALATSNTIVVKVNPTPVIEPNQVFTSTLNGVILTPKVSGNIVTWTWSPAGGLSAADIAHPIANPQRSTKYMLTVVSGDGCTASGEISVKVYSDIRIPGAFSPNGDGKNDIFYILSGPQGSTIRDFSVFDRWGVMVFGVHDVLPGDPAFGWNGYFKGAPAAAGTYAYTFSVTLAGGEQQVYKGTVILLR